MWFISPLNVPPRQTSVIGSRWFSGNLVEICERHQGWIHLAASPILTKLPVDCQGRKFALCVTGKLLQKWKSDSLGLGPVVRLPIWLSFPCYLQKTQANGKKDFMISRNEGSLFAHHQLHFCPVEAIGVHIIAFLPHRAKKPGSYFERQRNHVSFHQA